MNEASIILSVMMLLLWFRKKLVQDATDSVCQIAAKVEFEAANDKIVSTDWVCWAVAVGWNRYGDGSFQVAPP